MSSNSDEDDASEKTNIFRSDTVRVKMDPHYKVPPCLVLLVGPQHLMGRQWLLDNASAILGRNPDSNIHILEASLSKTHVKFRIEPEQVTITDLGATNGTLLNDKKLTPYQAYPLKNNDLIRTGSLTFKFLERGILSETTEKARMQSELETARTVQESLLPDRLEARYQWVQIGGRYQPARECSGDWWWHWSCGNKAFAIIGDATGHGASAALITSAARSVIVTMEDDPTIGIDKVYTTLSRAIRKCSGGNMAMSAFIVEVDLVSRKIRFVNASHLSAVCLPANSAGLNWSKLHFETNPVSPSLGSVEEKYAIGESVAVPGARWVLLTDGITERKDATGTDLKDRLFYTMLVEAHTANTRSQAGFLDSLVKKANELAQSALQEDDITVVALDFY